MPVKKINIRGIIMRKLLFLFVTAVLLFSLSSCKPGSNGNNGLLALLGLMASNGGGIPDDTAPVVIATTPVNYAIDVPLNTIIQITFSESIIATESDVTIEPSIAIDSFSVSGNTITIHLEELTEPEPFCDVTVGTGVTDIAGNALASAYTFSFEFGGGCDETAPTLASSDPATGATGVSVGKKITIRFSEAILAASITPETVILNQGATPVSCARDTSLASSGYIILTPDAPLSLNTFHTLILTSGITDTAVNPYAGGAVTFTTEAEADETPPSLISTNPEDGSTIDPYDLEVHDPYSPEEWRYFVTITFDDDIDDASLSGVTLVGDSSGPIVITPAVFGAQVLLETADPLDNDTYTVTLPASITDDAGNHYAGSTFSFTADDGRERIPPTLSSTYPENNATGVSDTVTIEIYFDEELDYPNIDSTNVILSLDGTPLSCTISAISNHITLDPDADLQLGETYTVTLTSGITDTAGNPYAGSEFSFTIEAVPDTTAPSLISSTPADGATIDPVDIYYEFYLSLDFWFDDDIDPDTLSGITLVGDTYGEIAVDDIGVYENSIYIVMWSSWLEDDMYTVTLPSTITDDRGNPYAGGTIQFEVINTTEP